MGMFTIEINETLCTSCGACARECGKGKARVAPRADGCSECLHCYAVCPAKAITVRGVPAPKAPADGTFIGFEEIEGFLSSRRSTRRFLPDELPGETLSRLLDAARYTPSGGNRRAHEVTVVPRGQTRDLLLGQLKRIYRKRSALLNNPLLRRLLRPFVGAYLRAFLDDPDYGSRIADLLARLMGGEDPIFYGAPEVVLFHSPVLIPTPKEDCILAAYAFTLAAQASGLGTCFVTLAQSAVNSSRACKAILGLAPRDAVHAVLLVGHPAVRFLRPAPRPSLPVHTCE